MRTIPNPFPNPFPNLSNFVVRLSCLAALALATPGLVQAQHVAATGTEPGAAALLEKHAALSKQLAENAYRRPLFLDSSEGNNMVSGNAYAVLDSPFSTVSTTFKSPHRWCEMLILHINTKYCHAGSDGSPSMLRVSVGKKTAQELADAFSLQFAYRLAAASPNYLAAQLQADKGPLGTNNYRIELQAVPLPGGKTFMHMRYSYGYGVASRLAMQGYLATVGNGKVGFTQVHQGPANVYVEGMRGAVERNTMRYYLAIEAYLASVDKPAAQQLELRLQHWFDATEQYPRQLHEVDKEDYLVMKRAEYQRQQTPL
ncbi:hypothetical protein [Polaromonas sp. SP1]|uniref:hypothetical protein n=1 Tax=unclassified Polaromonas TaxID=2638319 RepID=UPI0026912449